MKCITCNNNCIIISKYSKFKLFKCPKCDLMFWWPLEFDEEQYSRNFNYIANSCRFLINSYHKEAIKILIQLFAHENDISLLEIGCGNGSFLSVLLSTVNLKFSHLYGIDLNYNAVLCGKKKLGNKIIYGNFLENPFLEKKAPFDVICFFEVLEHQTKPNVFINRVKNLLKSGGIILGTVPNRDRYLPLNIREHIDYPPHHFTWWNKTALHNFLALNGFIDIEIFVCNKWNLLDLSLGIESILLGSLKRIIKKKIFVAKRESKNGTVYKVPFTYRFINNYIMRCVRAFFMLPFCLPFYIKYLKLRCPGRTLLFKARKR